MTKCTTCGAENPRFPGFQTSLCIKTAEGKVLFSVDTNTDECQDCASESIRMMHGEMRATDAPPENVKVFINVEELWEDVSKRPPEFLTEEQREERLNKSK